MTWSDRACAVIGEVRDRLLADAPYADRVAALLESYPFRSRENHPHQAWLKAQRAYLARYRPAAPHRRSKNATGSRRCSESKKARVRPEPTHPRRNGIRRPGRVRR